MNKLFSKLNRQDTRGIMRIALILWLAVSLLGTIPYLGSGYVDSFADALLESFSGFTTTGVTVFANPEKLPRYLLVYRAFTSWLGGAGVLVFLASLLKSFDVSEGMENQNNRYQLYRNGIRFGRIARRLLFTYFVMTVLCCAILFLSGESSADAFVYSCAAVSSGGFTPGAASSYHLNGATETVILVFMLLSCINFTVYYHILKKHFKQISENTELFTYLFIIVGAAVLVIADLKLTGTMDLQDAVHYGIFTTVSHATTCGIAITDISSWPAFARLLINILSFTGGCTASVGSGIKIMRLVLLAQIIIRSFTTRIHPQAVVAVKLNGKRVNESALGSAFSYLATYAFFFAAAVFILSFECTDFETPFLLSSALLNNLGGICVAGYSGLMKIFMCVFMLAGRLELYALLLPLSPERSN